MRVLGGACEASIPQSISSEHRNSPTVGSTAQPGVPPQEKTYYLHAASFQQAISEMTLVNSCLPVLPSGTKLVDLDQQSAKQWKISQHRPLWPRQ